MMHSCMFSLFSPVVGASECLASRPIESTVAFYTLCLYTPSLQKSSSCQPAIPNVFGLARHIRDQDYPSVVLDHQTAIQLVPLVRPLRRKLGY